MKKPVHKTIADKQSILARVATLRADGKSVPEACKAIGIKMETMYRYRNEVKKAAQKETTQVVTYPNDGPRPTRVPKVKSGKLAVVFGSSEQIQELIRGLQ